MPFCATEDFLCLVGFTMLTVECMHPFKSVPAWLTSGTTGEVSSGEPKFRTWGSPNNQSDFKSYTGSVIRCAESDLTIEEVETDIVMILCISRTAQILEATLLISSVPRALVRLSFQKV